MQKNTFQKHFLKQYIKCNVPYTVLNCCTSTAFCFHAQKYILTFCILDNSCFAKNYSEICRTYADNIHSLLLFLYTNTDKYNEVVFNHLQTAPL